MVSMTRSSSRLDRDEDHSEEKGLPMVVVARLVVAGYLHFDRLMDIAEGRTENTEDRTQTTSSGCCDLGADESKIAWSSYPRTIPPFHVHDRKRSDCSSGTALGGSLATWADYGSFRIWSYLRRNACSVAQPQAPIFFDPLVK